MAVTRRAHFVVNGACRDTSETDILLRIVPNLAWVESFSPSVGANNTDFV